MKSKPLINLLNLIIANGAIGSFACHVWGPISLVVVVPWCLYSGTIAGTLLD